MRRKVLTLTFSLFLILAGTVAALGCACCAERGHYSISVLRLDDRDREILRSLRFGNAELYTDAAGYDGIKGIRSVETTLSGDIDLVGNFTGNVWAFTIKAAGNAGTLSLRVPLDMVNYKADIRDRDDSPNGPVLYKERRFQSNVVATTGIFSPTPARTSKYFLVLQGRGNMCDEPEDYTHWRLEVSGRQANYAFFGSLTPAK